MDRDQLINHRYQVSRQLGEGGMGTVYLVRDNAQGGRPVALKILRPDALDPESVARFKEEFRAMARLRHPNLAEVYDFDTLQGDGRNFLTMEYVEGKDLGAFQGPDLGDRFDDLVVQCLRALDYIHSRGLLHNDIKPHNIMVRPPFDVKLLDFGLAQRQTDPSRPGLSGTIHFIAPERLKGERPDPRSDLYSLGVVLYQFLTGRLPFDGEDAGQVIGAILRGRPRPPREIEPEIPERIASFVLTLLQSDPTARPRSVIDALDILNRGLPTPLRLDTAETYASFVGSGRFVGRDAELLTLLDLASSVARETNGGDRDAPDGRPRLVLVSGPGGIGKSRLLREAKHRLQLAGIRCLTGRCYEDGGVPFQPFVEIVRQAPPGPGMPAEPRAVLDRIMPTGSATDSASSSRVAAETGRGDKAGFIAGLVSALDFLARDNPGVVFLEDLHWSDGPGIELLEQILLRSDAVRWLFVGSYREEEAASTPVGALLTRYRNVPRMHHLALKPLAPAQVTDLLASMLPFDERPEGLAGLLADRTEGNPLYIEELMKSLAEEGILRRSGGAFVTESRSLESMKLPSGLAGVVARRMAGLGPAERNLAEYLAVFNRPIGLRLLSRALGSREETARQSAEALGRLGLVVFQIESDGTPTIALVHSRIREPIYGALSDERRRTLHLAAGNAIEAEFEGAIDIVIEELAHHLTQAGERMRAANYNLRAARKALALFDIKSQDEHLRRALDLLPMDDSRRFEALETLAAFRCEDLIDLEGAMRYATQLEEEAGRAGDKSSQGMGLCMQGYALGLLSDPKAGIARLRRALVLARAGGRDRELTRCLLSLGAILGRAGRLREALPHLEEARRIGESMGRPETVIQALNNAGHCRLGLGEAEAGRRLFEEALAIARDHGLIYFYQRFLVNLGNARQEAGDLTGAIQIYEESLAWARTHGLPETIVHTLSGLGQAYAYRGLFDRAMRAHEEELAIRRQQENPTNQIMPLDFIGQELREMGRHDQAVRRHEEGLEMARALRVRLQEGHLLASLALDHLGKGGLEAASKRAREALAIGREIGHQRIACLALAATALIAARRGDRRAITTAARDLRRVDPRSLRYHERLFVHLVLGRCAQASGKHRDAERETRAGLAAAERGGFSEYQWKFLALLGEILTERGLPHDAAAAYNAAQRIIRQTASEIEDVDMQQDYEQDDRRKEVAQRGTESAPPAAAVGPSPQGAIPAGAPLFSSEDTPARMLTTIYEITQIINSILDLKELLGRVMDLAIEIVRAERGLIFLYRSETDEMEMVVARNMEKQTIKDATEYSRSILKQVGRGRPILSHDAASDARFKEFRSVSVFHIRSLLCVPLKIKDRVIGTVYVDTRQPGVVFTEHDLRFLEAFANQAAVAIENARLYDEVRQENRYLRQAVQERYGYENIIGRSPKMREVFTLLSRVAQSNLPVLIRGESGTGKELVARAIHHNSARKDQKFFSENCAALPDTLLESELFGHVKGAFTGAEISRKGLFELSHAGTLFLDEVGDMSVPLQSKLLRVLQDGEVRPVGSESTHHVDVRIISATNRNLEQMIKEKKFREDLYFRLNVISVTIPALRDRIDDIPLLVDHFLGRVARENNATKLRIDPALMALLTRYDWPGNVRELENAVYRLALFASGDTLTLKDAKNDVEFYERVTAPGTRGADTRVTRSDLEQALSRAKGNREEAARLLGISRATMFRKVRQFDLGPKRPRHHRRTHTV